MSLYQIIYDFLLTLFPVNISEQCLAWVRLASLTSITLLYIVGVMFIVAIFKFVSGLFTRL